MMLFGYLFNLRSAGYGDFLTQFLNQNDAFLHSPDTENTFSHGEIIMRILDSVTRFLTQLLTWLAGVFLVGMILLTCANISCRLFWVPIRGTFELMGFFGAIVATFSLGYTQIRRGHVAVDVLVNTFSEKPRAVLNMINDAICLVFFIIAAWQITEKATTLMRTGEVTETLRIIYYPFTYAVAFGCLVLSLVFLTELLRAIFPEEKGGKA